MGACELNSVVDTSKIRIIYVKMGFKQSSANIYFKRVNYKIKQLANKVSKNSFSVDCISESVKGLKVLLRNRHAILKY